MSKKNKIINQWAQKLFNNGIIYFMASKIYALTQFFSHKLKLKNRHLLTRSNTLRLRYVAGFTTFLLAALLSFSLNSFNLGAFQAYQFANIMPAAGHPDISKNVINGGLHGDFAVASIVSNAIPEPLPLDREITIQSGDALGLVMEKQGIGNEEASNIIKIIQPHFDPRHIKAGQKIDLHFEEARDDSQRFREMKMKLDPIKTLIVARAGDNFTAKIDEKEVKKVIKAKQAEVKVSLYGSAAQAGIPKSVVADAIKIFSWNVDFQRDIRPNNVLEVMYESYETEDGHVSKTGNILYTKLKLNNREIPLYRFKMSDGRVDYFQPDGRSIKRTLMKTPINGARMSSGFGKRRHPVLGYTKMHKGVDFAASTGTPIFAAGDGVVEKAGWFSSYGKYIRIRHNSKLKTAYAHMSKINSKVKSGQRVRQGQVIGYVGTTGRSTGPHLHYEVISNGRQVNPRSVNLPIGEELTGKQMASFKAVVNKLRRQYAGLLDGTKVAETRKEKKSFF